MMAASTPNRKESNTPSSLANSGAGSINQNDAMVAAATIWQHGSTSMTQTSRCCFLATSSYQWKPPSLHPPHCAVSIHLHVIASEILSPLRARVGTKLFSLLILKRPETLDLTFPNRVKQESCFPFAHLSRDTRISTCSCWEATQSPAIGLVQMVTGSLLTEAVSLFYRQLTDQPFKSGIPQSTNKEIRKKKASRAVFLTPWFSPPVSRWEDPWPQASLQFAWRMTSGG